MQKVLGTIFVTKYLEQYFNCSEKELYKEIKFQIENAPGKYFPLLAIKPYCVHILNSEYKNIPVKVEYNQGLEIIEDIFIFLICYPYNTETWEIHWDKPIFAELGDLWMGKCQHQTKNDCWKSYAISTNALN